jgi:hypothetical protein
METYHAVHTFYERCMLFLELHDNSCASSLKYKCSIYIHPEKPEVKYRF